jgi:hypothetical protein
MKEKISFNDNIDNKNNHNYDININKEIDSSSLKDKIISFFNLIDKEIKKIYIFYSSKEKDLYQNINKKIKNKEIMKNNSCNDIFGEIDKLEYLSNLCLELLKFIYLNIRALLNILTILDNHLNTNADSISYKYLKKYLSKDNSDLIYILSFRVLDETILAIQGLLSEYKNCLKNSEEYLNNFELKNQYKEYKRNIKKNFENFDEIHEKIFNKLTVWQKYLDINLDLPSSSNHSIFEDTPFVGDYLGKKNKTKSKIKVKNDDNNDI